LNLVSRQTLYFGILSLLTFVLYFPSIFELPRADHLAYLADQSHKGFFNLTFGSYNLNRIREFISGDEILFRPIFYFILGGETWLFGHYFEISQCLGLILQLGILWWVLKVFLYWGFDFFSLILACYIATLVPAIEFISWGHLHGYLVFLICLLASVYHAMEHVREGEVRPSRLLTLLCYLSVAVFSYELGIFLCLGVAVYFWLSSHKDTFIPKHSGLMILGIPLLYFIFSFVDYYLLQATSTEKVEFKTAIFSWETIKNLIYVNGWWFDVGTFLKGRRLLEDPVGRISFVESNSLESPALIHYVPIFFQVLLVLLYLYLLLRTMRTPFFKARIWLSCMLAGVIVSYDCLITMGRIFPRGFGSTLNNNIYYAYTWWILVIILLASLVDVSKIRQMLLEKTCYLLGILLVGISAWHSLQVYRANEQMAVMSQSGRNLVREIDLFMNEHKKEPITFSLSSSVPGNPTLLWLTKKGDPGSKTYTFLDTLYPGCYVKTGGLYVFDGKKWIRNYYNE
jgi:hypothetical protein